MLSFSMGIPGRYRSMAPHGKDARDHKHSVNPWTLVFGCLILGAFLLSAAYSFVEARYMLWGRLVQAQLVEVKKGEISQGRGVTTPILVFQYHFLDGERGLRLERDTVSIDWPRPTGNRVDVQYIPEEPGSSRLVGHGSLLGPFFFLGCLAALAWIVTRLAREANAPFRKPRAGTASR